MYRAAVQGSHLMQFTRSLGDLAADHDDVDRMLAVGEDALVAPPTFLMATDHFDPNYERRPRPGLAWVGSQEAHPDQPVGFHVEQYFTFHRPVRAGQVLTVESRPGTTWRRTGRRAGTMDFSEILTDYCLPTGEQVASARWVQAAVAQRPPGPTTPAPTTPAPTTLAPTTQAPTMQAASDPLPDTRAPSGRSEVGQAWTTVLVEGLTRAQIVMYAGASGDFHPLHCDDDYARRRGYPGVFAHGMLTMGMSGRAVTDRYGHGAVLQFGGRITGQAWPGDTLVATTEVTAVHDDARGTTSDLQVTTRNHHGSVLFAGQATVLS